MLRKALLAAAGLALALPALAGQATKEVPITDKGGLIDVGLSVDNINLRQVDLSFKGKLGGPLQKSKGEAKCFMDNNGEKDTEVGIAIVLMDEAGNVVGATSAGTKVGPLKKGQRDTSTVDFGYVYRNQDKARRMIVTLETAPR
ncbi:MAG TPA: hypothetical protein VIB08_00205 [Thermoanaerobaculia bacterium]|jgi:hypothetical protein